mmetsp:Transcript_779/g.1756  ORF Transcript_779/g.1756 Transcript_779/m.1756 type:complete len:173 (-) Transcript_779:462-980(-)
MANAAAKKAAAARKAAAATYLPVVVALNAVYLLLRLFRRSDPWTIYGVLATVALTGLSFVSYKGILEDHANNIPSMKSSEALAGGASLDLLGLVAAVQYGTVFVSDKFYWLLAVIPLWGGWKIYSTFFGSKNKDSSGFMPESQAESTDDAASEKVNEKRQRRAERRRQKWSS